MRLNNRSKKGLFHFINTLVIMIFAAGVTAYFLDRFFFKYVGWSSILFIIIPTLIVAIVYFRGRQIFEYDSDGEALNFKNSNVIIYLSKPLNDEFPKYKLMSYEILNGFILKRLFVKISSKKSTSILLKYDVSYLTKKELKDLKISLSKVVRLNKERAKS